MANLLIVAVSILVLVNPGLTLNTITQLFNSRQNASSKDQMTQEETNSTLNVTAGTVMKSDPILTKVLGAINITLPLSTSKNASDDDRFINEKTNFTSNVTSKLEIKSDQSKLLDIVNTTLPLNTSQNATDNIVIIHEILNSTSKAGIKSDEPKFLDSVNTTLPLKASQNSSNNDVIVRIKTASNFSSDSNSTFTPNSGMVGNNCPPFYYSCNDNRLCVPSEVVCDYIDDCPDGSDELESICRTKELELVMCHNGQILKGYRLICNDIIDCADGSDEVNCETSQQECDYFTQFSCMDSKNTCVQNIERCDGYEDCQNGFDEYPQFCDIMAGVRVKVSFVFKQYMSFDPQPDCNFHCGNGKCLSMNYRCDGINDCRDGRDEVGCDKTSKDEETNHGFNNKKPFTVLIALGTTCGVIIFLALLCLAIKKRKPSKSQGKIAEINKLIALNHNFSPPPSYSEIAQNNDTTTNKINSNKLEAVFTTEY